VLIKHIGRASIVVALLTLATWLGKFSLINFGILTAIWLFETIAMALWVRDARKKGICTIGSH
jgi:hypothetical protein